MGAARSVLRDLADESRHRGRGDRHDLRRRRRRLVRPGGLEVQRSGHDLDALQRGSRLRGRGRPDQGGVEPVSRYSRPVRRRRAGRAVPKRRRWAVMAARRWPARPPVAPALAAGRRRADPAFPRAPSGGRAPALGRDLLGRRLLYGRRRRHVGAAQSGDARGLHARGPEIPRDRPVRALPGDGGRHARSPVPAEPLRHVPQRGRRPAVGEHRGGPAVELRVPRGGPSARTGHALSACR